MGQKSRYILPTVIDPPTSTCYQVPVPNDPQHLAAFKGALYGLAKAYEWQNDVAHTAKDVAAVWLRIFNELEKCKPCATNTGFSGASGEDDLMLRQNPDNPCELQNSVDGVTWCTWADLSLCFGASQPGGGSPQPQPGGGEQCYTAKLNASSQWLLPTTVNTGDTIHISNAQGAATDGGSNWTCPDGSLFVGGFCIDGLQTYQPGDPVPLAPHMSIIANIAGTFYQVPIDTDYTVPGGISNAQVTFQVNDDPISDNSGDLAFQVCVTNNAEVAWSHSFSFAVTAARFGPQAYNPGDVVGATYVLGDGWQAQHTNAGVVGETNRFTVDDIIFDWVTPTTLKSVSAHIDVTLGGNAGGSTLGQYIEYRTGGTNTVLTSISPVTGANQLIAWTGTQSATGLRLHGVADDAGPGNVGAGTEMWLNITVSGEGFDPWA